MDIFLSQLVICFLVDDIEYLK